MTRISTLVFALLCLSQFSWAQTRYLDPVFAEAEIGVTTEVYATNATIIGLVVGQANEAVPQPLRADIYAPVNDDITERPLIIMTHTGNFLPPQLNGGCTGTFRDATVRRLATRLAQYGYVVASIEYRIGWNPIAQQQATRVFTLINAAYRGVQDSRTAVRYFNRTVVENDNPHGIDTSRVVMWGIGTGGYISLASATLDRIEDTYVPKFFIGNTPMVIEPINGDINGEMVGIVPEGYPGFPVGDTLNYPNHVGYSNNFHMAVNMGGAMGDSTWIDADDIPILSFHVPTDPFAPCETAVLNVPEPPLPIVEVSGSCDVQVIVNRLGNNDCMANGPIALDGEITATARERSEIYAGADVEGFFPFLTDDILDSAPWNYSENSNPYGANPDDDCDTDFEGADMAMDTIIQYFAPRAYNCMNLTTSVEELVSSSDIQLKVSPVPADGRVFIETGAEYPVDEMILYDFSGRQVAHVRQINSSSFTFEARNLPAGLYIAKLKVGNRIASQKLIFR